MIKLKLRLDVQILDKYRIESNQKHILIKNDTFLIVNLTFCAHKSLKLQYDLRFS